MFLQGIENEKSGKLYEAIQFYKKAVQLVPDIEFRLYESTKSKFREKTESEENADLENSKCDTSMEKVEELDIADNCDILGKLSRITEKNGYVCLPRIEQTVRRKYIQV